MILRAILIVGTAAALLALPGLARAQHQAVGWQVPGPILVPSGNWQVPKDIQVPTGPWQVPGELQVPKGIEAVRSQSAPCETRLSLLGDALFDFDSAELRPDAATTLEVAGSRLEARSSRPAAIEGHTDAKGSDSYNQVLSERRAEAVKAWLVSRGLADVSWRTVGYGETRPVAPNTGPDGSDDPAGRQRNRRVEILLPTCG